MPRIEYGMVIYTLEEMKGVCPECADKMEESHIKEVVLPVSYFSKDNNLPDKFEKGRPPKKWWDDCVSSVGKAKGIKDPSALCGWIWHHHMKHGEGEPKIPTDEKEIETIVQEIDNEKVKSYARTETLEGVEIFRTGRWNDDEYTEKDLLRMVDNFNVLKEKGKLSVPVKIGHSEKQDYLKKEGIPAAGWVDKLKMVGDSVVARITDIPKKIYEIVKNKAYRKTSAEIYPAYKTSDGDKFKTVLRAVAFLGGDIPAVEGISDITKLYKEETEQKFKVYEIGKEINKYSFKIGDLETSKKKFVINVV